MPYSNVLVIKIIVANKKVRYLYVDNRAVVSILYSDCFRKLGVDKANLKLFSLLYTFAQGEVHPKGVLSLLVAMGDYPKQKTMMIDFCVVSDPSPYKIIFRHD